MAFQVNTNINALNAHAQSTFTQSKLANSLEKLSSGLRINKAADDASGLAIADDLRAQADSLGQAIRNSNDTIGIIQIADKAMDEQVSILNTIKTKATQAAQDGQTTSTRRYIQADINRLIEGLDNIAATTTYNGQSLLSGAFTNKSFQIGAYSNQTVNFSIGATSSDKVGQVRLETTGMIDVSAGASALSAVTLKFMDVDGVTDVTLESVKISHSAGTGIGALVEVINKNSNLIRATATYNVQGTGSAAVAAGSIKGLKINDITIGDISGISANDSDGRLTAAINAAKDRTGVEATVDEFGRLNLKSTDGRAIKIEVASGGATGAKAILGGGSFAQVSAGGASNVIVGRISLIRLDARDIKISGTNFANVGFVSGSTALGNGNVGGVAQTTVNLRDMRGAWNMDVACAAGMNANLALSKHRQTSVGDDNQAGGAGVTNLEGAMISMSVADSAIKMLDSIRSDLGSVQNQLISTINNITITQVNVKSAEANIREVDFAAESANFNKLNILAQSGSYAMSQANSVQQNILRLLQ